MAKAKGATSAAEGNALRDIVFEDESTDLVDPAHDLHATVDDVDPSETPQDFSGGYHSIHDSDDYLIHTEAEADEGEDDDGVHVEMVMGFDAQKNLTAPPPRDGYSQCWVNKTNKDFRIMSRRGYTPRDPATLPKGYRIFQTDREEQSDFIEAADMILMEIKAPVLKQRMAEEDAYSDRLQQASAEHLKSANEAGARMGAKPITGRLERS